MKRKIKSKNKQDCKVEARYNDLHNNEKRISEFD